MDLGLNENTVLTATDWCVVRPQKGHYVVYNSRSDELHLMSESAYCVFQLCEGLNTAGEIRRLVTEATGDDETKVETRVDTFLRGLITRGLVEVDHD